MRFFSLLTLAAIAVIPPRAAAAAPIAEGTKLEFRADKYVRDLRNDTAVGQGNAELRFGPKRLRADRIELDYKAERAFADGNVRYDDGPLSAVARHANVTMRGYDATLEDATITSGKLVLTGASLRRTGEKSFVAEEATYSSCNLETKNAADITPCEFDWKVYGRRIALEMEGYAHVYDAIVFARELPIFYLPYFFIPVKARRTAGFLWPSFSSSAPLGSGISLPFFWDISPWQDLTLTPTFYSRAGFALGTQYRYAYSSETKGSFDISLTRQRYGRSTDEPYPALGGAPRRALGWIGEGAIQAHNRIGLGERSYSRQDIRLVSNPFFTLDFPNSFGPQAELGYLRSQVAVTMPSDHWFAAIFAQHYGSLIVSKDRNVDEGPVTELPTAIAAIPNTPVWDRFLLVETDLRMTHFYRGESYDRVPAAPLEKGDNGEPGRAYRAGDYIRTGSRLWVEPRLIANFALPEGLQFQPMLRVGSRLYQFTEPTNEWVARPYAELEVPFGFYLRRNFERGGTGPFARISHAFQPRVILGARREFEPTSPHPFFFQDPLLSRSNPRFDAFDRTGTYEYARFELINRFRRRTASGQSERFFWFQVGQQYNLRTFQEDPRFARRLGPVEWLGDLTVGGFSAQFQGIYALEAVSRPNGSKVHEKDVSTSVAWAFAALDRIHANGLWRTRADRSLSVESLVGGFYKELPTFFDVAGEAEYSLLAHELRGYSMTLRFRAKPVSCWELLFTTGRNAYRQPFALVNFRFDFGGPKKL